MKLKYYMRGLGIGIILTTLIFIISGYEKKMTDEEIIASAKKLGMIMEKDRNKELDDIIQKVTPEVVPEPSPELTQAPEASVTPEPETTTDAEATPEPEITPDPETTPDPEISPKPTPEDDLPSSELTPSPSGEESVTPSPEITETPNDSDTSPTAVTFTIDNGMSSLTVANLLEELGVVEDAIDFNQFIVKEGKARLIRIGTYTVEVGADYKEILDVITKTR